MNLSIYNIEERKTIILILTLALGGFLLYGMSGLFSAFLGAVVLYTIFRPVFVWMIERKQVKSWIASLVILLASFLIIVLPFSFIFMMIANKANDFFMLNQNSFQYYFIQVRDFLGIEFTDAKFIEKAINFIQNVLIGKVSGAINGIFSGLLTVTIMYFVLYFMIVNYQVFERTLLRFMPFNPQDSQTFARELTNSTNANVLGQGFIAIIQGSLVMLGFVLFNFPDAVFWGVISMFLSFMPIIGAPVVFVPAALIALSQGDKFGGYGMLIWGFGLVTNIDNVLRFLIVKKFANTHPLITILGVIIGFPIFGILGLVFGPLLISYFLILVKIYETRKAIGKEKKEKLKRKNKIRPELEDVPPDPLQYAPDS